MAWSNAAMLVTCAENDRLVNVFDLDAEDARVTLTSSEVVSALSVEGQQVIAVSTAGIVLGWDISASELKSKKPKSIESSIKFSGDHRMNGFKLACFDDCRDIGHFFMAPFYRV